jgi:type IV fimbrial biogenesis protein FimT
MPTNAFTLIELLIVIAITTIITLLTIPCLQKLIITNRAQSYTNEMVLAMKLARTTAIKLGEQVLFCASKNHKQCRGSWNDGSIVIIKKSRKILRTLPPIFNGDKLTGSHETIITFTPDGFSKGHQISFTYRAKNSHKNIATIILNSTGRIRVNLANLSV